MKNTSTYHTTCPHCGAIKRIAFSTIPWSKAESIMWSDGRTESTEWCGPAWTQQCPSCKHFFALPIIASPKVENVLCENTGTTTITFMAKDEFVSFHSTIEEWSDIEVVPSEDRFICRISHLQS